MSQLVRYTSLFLLILGATLSHGQCPLLPSGWANGSFKISSATNTTGIPVSGQDNSPLVICEGEQIVLNNTNPSNGTPSDYYLVHAQSLSNATQASPLGSSPTLPSASYTPSASATSTIFTISAAGFGYQYKGSTEPDAYFIIQKSNALVAGFPTPNYACKAVRVISASNVTPKFTTASCIDGSVAVELNLDATNNIFNSYTLNFVNAANTVNISGGTITNPTLPKSFSTAPLLNTGVTKAIVTGQTLTAGCPNLFKGEASISVTAAKKPRAGLIIGQATNGTYEVEFIAEKGIKREVFIREANANYNYAVPFSNFISGDPTTRDREIKIYTVPDATKQYCFIARAVESNSECPLIGTEVVADEEACTTTLKITAGDKKNQLTWSPFVTGMLGGVFQSYEIYREGTVFPIKKITVAGTTSYDDDEASLVCGTTYKYTLKTIYGSQSTSSPVEVEFKQTTKSDSYDRIYATVSEDNSTVTLIPSNASGSTPPIDAVINIYRKEFNSGTYSKYVVASQDKIQGIFFDKFDDKQVETTKKQYCYYVTWELGLCGESNPSKEACTILLKKTGEDLTWTPENPMSVPIGQYSVINARDPNSSQTAGGDFALTGSTNFSLLSIPESRGQEFWIRIEVGNSNGTKNPVSYSNYIHYERPLAVLLPQVFTPDGNAMNETFDIQGKHIRKTKMWIYDRWGSPIFYKEAENKEDVTTGLWIDTGWDGTLSNGQKAPQGNYVYKVEIEDSVGKISIKSGALIVAY